MILNQPLSVPICAHAVVRDAVQQNDGITVCFWRTHQPGTKNRAVGSSQFHIVEFDIVFLCSRSRVAFLGGCYGTTVRVECDPAEANPTYDGARNVKEHQNVQQRPKDRTIPRERFFHESDLWLHG